MDFLKEWFVEAPWGKIALVSWGSTAGDPVLLVHGRQDSLSTFKPLLHLMPKNYYYVALDMPGNGRSDPFPIGIKLTRLHFVSALELAIERLGWKQFIYIGHSMGCEHGLFYNAVYPGVIKKFIFLDFGPSLQRLQINDHEEFYRATYDDHYSHYDLNNLGYKVYTREKALEAVMRARGLTKAQADLILARNLIEIDDGLYRDLWMWSFYAFDYYMAVLFDVFALLEKIKALAVWLKWGCCSPPTLLVAASDGSGGYVKGKEDAQYLMGKMQRNLKDFFVITVEGGHDVHFTHPEKCAGSVCEFMGKDFVKSKL